MDGCDTEIDTLEVSFCISNTDHYLIQLNKLTYPISV